MSGFRSSAPLNLLPQQTFGPRPRMEEADRKSDHSGVNGMEEF